MYVTVAKNHLLDTIKGVEKPGLSFALGGARMLIKKSQPINMLKMLSDLARNSVNNVANILSFQSFHHLNKVEPATLLTVALAQGKKCALLMPKEPIKERYIAGLLTLNEPINYLRMSIAVWLRHRMEDVLYVVAEAGWLLTIATERVRFEVYYVRTVTGVLGCSQMTSPVYPRQLNILANWW